MAEPATVPERVFLQPGEIVIFEKPGRVRTILGSCVAVTMWAPRTGMAAVSHCLLPNAAAPASALPRAEALRYVDATIDLMLLAFALRGVTASELEVKLFGGSGRTDDAREPSGYNVGGRNVETALRVLAERGIVPRAHAVGGQRGRVIDFDSANGDVMVQRLPSIASSGGGQKP